MKNLTAMINNMISAQTAYLDAHAIAKTIAKEIPEATRAAKAPEGIQTDWTGIFTNTSEDPFFAGMCLQTQLARGPRGWQTRVTSCHPGGKRVEATLVPEKNLDWTPKTLTTYQVRLTRQIGQGRRQVWLIVPIDATWDERREGVVRAIQNQFYQEVDTEAEEWASSKLSGLELPPRPEYPSKVSKVQWTWESQGRPEKYNHNGHRMEQVTGVAIATWEGRTGRYNRTTRHQYVTDRYPSSDGRRMCDESGWKLVGEDLEFLSGEDIAAEWKTAANASRGKSWADRCAWDNYVDQVRDAAVDLVGDAGPRTNALVKLVLSGRTS